MKNALISIILTLTLLLSVSCGKADETSATVTESGNTEVTTQAVPTEPSSEEPTTEAPTEAPTETPTEAPTEEPTEAPTEEPPEPVTEPAPEPSPDSVTVENIPYGTNTASPILPTVTFTVNDPGNTRGLDTASNGFGFGVASGGQPHNITVNNQARFDGYGTGAFSWDNKSGEKVLYLTFDCGYAYGDLVTRMLDTLKEKNVPAAFFGTLDYLKSAPAEVQRMIDEGHIVGNHSTTHPSDSAALSRAELASELLGVHNYLLANFGYECKYFRFPTGAYSVNALDLVHSVGYKSVFWSIAYQDWDPEDQLGTDIAFDTVTSRLHPGAVILLHSTSPDNADILADFIDYAVSQGYTFRSLDEYGL